MSAVTAIPAAPKTSSPDPSSDTSSDTPPDASAKPALVREQPTASRAKRDVKYLGTWPFLLVHAIAAVGLFYFEWTWSALAWVFGSYYLRMLAVTGGYHRYFSHRTFRTSRVGQFILAFMAQTSAQKGILWWGAHHRHHHKFSDQPDDMHSPVQDSFWYSHMWWVWDTRASETKYEAIKDFAKFPELRFLETVWWMPPWLYGFACYFVGGWEGVFWGLFVSTTLLWHGTYTINSLSHVFGKRRFATTDDSRNNWLLSLVTLGEGWHNNHHHYMHCTRQGFYWWEVDVTYYVIKALSWVGVVWDVREPPARVLEQGRSAAG